MLGGCRTAAGSTDACPRFFRAAASRIAAEKEVAADLLPHPPIAYFALWHLHGAQPWGSVLEADSFDYEMTLVVREVYATSVLAHRGRDPTADAIAKTQNANPRPYH